MKSPFQFIVKPLNGKRYNNTKEISGTEFITSTSEEDHKFSNRYAEVIETPLGYEGKIKIGDTLLVHHNVFKFYFDMQEQFFMYKQDGEWNAYDRYCFVEPLEVQDSYIYKATSKEPLMGVMRYPNEYLKSQGVSNGDKVCFTPESEYEFIVDEKTMYRVYDHQITIKL